MKNKSRKKSGGKKSTSSKNRPKKYIKQKLPPKPIKSLAEKSGGVSWQLHSGNDYLEFPPYDRTNYVAGLSDAYNWSFDGGFTKMKWLMECSKGKPMDQLAAMFDKWLKNNPERWHEPAAKLYPFAMFELCQPKAQAEKSTN